MPSGDSVQVHVSDHGTDLPILTFEGAMKEVMFGTFAGMVAELFEYPFDLAKVRLQSQLLAPKSHAPLRFNGPMDCLKQTWRGEGFRGLYRGLPAPIIGSMAETAALFLTYSSFQTLIRAYSSTIRDPSHPARLSISEVTTAAAGAGFFTSFIITPIELVKCKMQVQMMNMPISARTTTSTRLLPTLISPIRVPPPLPAFSGSSSAPLSSALRPPGLISVIRSTVQTYGVGGLWLGHTGTMIRETGGTAAWFAVKEWVAGALQDRRAISRSYEEDDLQRGATRTTLHMEIVVDLLPWESAFSGAIAGAACVLAIYPADTVKSAMQTEDELRPRGAASTSKRAFGSPTFWSTLTRMYAGHGIRGLYAGCGMTVARAVPGSSIIFVVYDGLSAWFG